MAGTRKKLEDLPNYTKYFIEGKLYVRLGIRHIEIAVNPEYPDFWIWAENAKLEEFDPNMCVELIAKGEAA